MPILHSNNINFIDLTDEKEMNVYISSNLPTIQIVDNNKTPITHSPDWTVGDGLVLKAIIYSAGDNITDDITVGQIYWYRQIGNENRVFIKNAKELVINVNELTGVGEAVGVISYICSVKRGDNDVFENQISFSRTDVGTNGADAPTVQAQYSADGTTNWATTLDSSTHKFIRFSYNGGNDWSTPIKIAGEDGSDGTSVNILGVAYAQTTPVIGQTIDLWTSATVQDDTTKITDGENGDSYLVDGYLCVYNSNVASFICAGHIQGPKGEQGTSNYLFVRYASDANGSGMSISPTGKSYIGFYHSTENRVPTSTDASIWNWVKFVGSDGKNITLTGSAQAFKLNKDGVITPSTITVTAQTYNTTVTDWTYSIDGGVTFLSTATGITRSGNKITINGSMLTTNSVSIKASDGTYSDVFTVYKVSDGVDGTDGSDGASAYTAFLTNENISFVANSQGNIAGITIFSNVVVYKGTEEVMPILDTIEGIPNGMSITASAIGETAMQLAIKIEDNANLGSSNSNYGSITIPIISPIGVNLKLNWSKINSGRSVSSISSRYAVSDSDVVVPTTWEYTMPIRESGQYLWMADYIIYNDGTNAMVGERVVTGDAGISISSVTSYFANSKSTTIVPTTGWETIPNKQTNYYTWRKDLITYSNGTSEYTTPVCITGDSGESNYVHIRYRANEGETELSTEPNDYMGVYSGTSPTAPTDVSSYTWYNVKGDSGTPGDNAVIFQIYSNNGYILSKNLQEITLQTFAYKGSSAITSGATYQWAYSTGDGWTNISGATQPYLNVVHSEIESNKSYMCTMTFEGLEYTYVVTVEDKTDIKQIFTSKPISYSSGDIWIVGNDYIPSGIDVGTILRSEHTRDEYLESDWISATKYDKIMDDIVSDINKYNQYFSFDSSTGITMAAIDSSGKRSPFSTVLSNTKLSFNQGEQEVAYINNNKLNITEAEVISPLTVTGKYSGNTMLQAPTINIGNFSLIVESNGSLSIVANI